MPGFKRPAEEIEIDEQSGDISYEPRGDVGFSVSSALFIASSTGSPSGYNSASTLTDNASGDEVTPSTPETPAEIDPEINNAPKRPRWDEGRDFVSRTEEFFPLPPLSVEKDMESLLYDAQIAAGLVVSPMRYPSERDVPWAPKARRYGVVSDRPKGGLDAGDAQLLADFAENIENRGRPFTPTI